MEKVRFLSLKTIAFLYMFLYIGKGSFLVASMDFRYNAMGTFLYFLCLLLFIIRGRRKNGNQYTKLIGISFLIWLCCHLFKDSVFSPLLYYSLLIHIICGYLLIKYYGRDFIIYYDKVIFFLALASLFFWVIELAGGTELLLESPLLLENTAGNSDYSLLVYTLAGRAGRLYQEGLIRNSGCAWEPGLFSTMINIGIVCRIYMNHGQLKLFDYRFLILVAALVSTFSTTGYMTFFVIIGVHIIKSYKMSIFRKVIVGITFSYLAYSVYQVPFLSEKIDEASDVNSFAYYSNDKLSNRDENFTVDRFEGIYLDYLNLQKDPIVGYGANREESYVYKYISPFILTSNSLTKPLAQYGLPLGLLVLFLLFIGTREISRYYNPSNPNLLFIAIMLSSVSYNMLDNPVVMALLFYSLFYIKNGTYLNKY